MTGGGNLAVSAALVHVLVLAISLSPTRPLLTALVADISALPARVRSVVSVLPVGVLRLGAFVSAVDIPADLVVWPSLVLALHGLLMVVFALSTSVTAGLAAWALSLGFVPTMPEALLILIARLGPVARAFWIALASSAALDGTIRAVSSTLLASRARVVLVVLVRAVLRGPAGAPVGLTGLA